MIITHDIVNGGQFEMPKGAEPLLRMDAADLRQAREQVNTRRLDALAPGRGFHLARQLEHVYNETLREEFPPQSAFEAFPIDTSVPVGARSHTVRRITQQGEARVYRANSGEVPRVGVSQEEESFPVHHYVIGIEMSIFDIESSNFAGSNLRSELQTAAQVTMMEFANHKSWFGDDAFSIYGVFNYPWLPKMVMPVAAKVGSDPDAFLAQMNKAANYAHEESKTVYSPNALRVSPRVRRYMATTRIGTVNDTKILDDFLKANPRITSVEESWELQGSGPGGTDGMLFYRRDKRSIANVIPRMFTMLPAQESGFAITIPCVMSHGGMVQRDPLNNLLAFVEAE